MKNLNADVFKESSRKKRNLLIIGLLLLGLTILLIYLGVKNEKKELPQPENLSLLNKKLKAKENMYSYVEVATKPNLFAVYETDGIEDENKFYLAMDKENHLYILYINSSKYKELNHEDINNNPIKVLGITKKIPSDIKKLAIESYNELMEDEYLTEDNFKEYVGLLYLDTESLLNDSSYYYMGASFIGFFSLLIIIIVFVIYILNKRKLSKMDLVELSKIDNEILQMANSEYYNMKFYLLKDYLVDIRNNIIILKYTDILWAYPFEQRYNGMLVNKYLKIKDINNKTYEVASTKLLSKSKDETLQEILKKLKEKNQSIIIGYGKENKEQYKIKLKEIKDKKKEIHKH